MRLPIHSMDLLNKIKLIFTNKQEKKGETIKGIIQIEELPSKLESKINELARLKRQFKDDLLGRISNFEAEANKKIIVLESIDISQRKEHDRIKTIVKENLHLYILHLKRTIDNIKEAEKEEIEEYINRLSSTLNEFGRVSSKPFEKATILIGDELSDTRMIIISLIKDVNKIMENNNFLLEKGRLCLVLTNLLSESKQLNLLNADFERELAGMNAALEKAKGENSLLKNKLLEIKEGNDFKEDNQEKIDYRNKLDFLEREIQAIKIKLDLKYLLKKFHYDKKIDQLVRDYMADFKGALMEDKDLRIIGVIANNDKKDFSRLKEIQTAISITRPPSATKTDKEITFLEEKIEEEILHILSLENETKNGIKRKEKLSMKLQKINSDLMEHSKLLFE